MSKLRVASFTISLDGFGAGPGQDIDNPLGVGGTSLHVRISAIVDARFGVIADGVSV